MYDKVLPFYRKAPALSTFREVVPVNRILPSPQIRNEEFESLIADDLWKSAFKFDDDDSFAVPTLDFPMIRVLPLDVYIPATMSDRAAAFASVLIANQDQFPDFKALVRTVDYADVFFRMELTNVKDGRGDAIFATFMGYDVEEDVSLSVIEYVLGGRLDLVQVESSYRPEFSGEVFESRQQLEDFRRMGTARRFALDEGLLDTFAGSRVDSVRPEVTTDNIEMAIEQYLSHPAQFGTAHLLKGLTGVAKSAVIKGVCKRLGYRMIDFRAAFIDKLDLMGPIKLVREGEKTFYDGAPMKKIVECTDEFMDYAQQMVDYLSDLQEKNPDRSLSSVIEYYRERTKVPVLFFDEITRASGAIRNALFDVVDRKFLNYNMTRCRVIAATNEDIETAAAFGVSYDGSPKKNPFAFSTTDGSDGAFRARFNTIEVMSGQVAGRWLDWAKRGGVPPVLYDFLKQEYDAYLKSPEVTSRPERAVANAGPLYDYENVRTDDEEVASVTPYPNYRTWDILGQYLTAKLKESAQSEAGSPPVVDTQILQKLIGNHARSWSRSDRMHEALQTHLRSNGFEVVDSESPQFLDPISFRLRECMMAQIPLMMLGPTSLGKTGRANGVSKELFGEKPFKITLSQKDRTDILGFPVAGTVSDFTMRMLKDAGADDLVDPKLLSSMASKLPESLSDYAPDANLYRQLKEAADQGRPVVLFFEEYTRADKITQSAVFEAISDRRFMGVDFPPGLHVSVIAAGNYGSNYRDTKQMDSAMAARFVMDVQDGYSVRDAVALLSHFEGTRYTSVDGRQVAKKDERLAMHPSVLSFFRDLFNRDAGVSFTDMLASIERESDQTEGGVTSPRAWENVSNLLTIADSSKGQGLGFPLVKVIIERAVEYGKAEILGTLPPDISFENDPVQVLEWVLNMAAVLKAVLNQPQWILTNSPSIFNLDKKASVQELVDFVVEQAPTYDVSVEGMGDLKDVYAQLKQTIDDLIVLEDQAMASLKYQVIRFIGNYNNYGDEFFDKHYNNALLDPYLSVWLAVYRQIHLLVSFMPPNLTPAMKARLLGLSEDEMVAQDIEKTFTSFDKIDQFVSLMVNQFNLSKMGPNEMGDIVEKLVLQDLYRDPSDRTYPLVSIVNKLAAALPGVAIGAQFQSRICSNEFLYRQVTMCLDAAELTQFYEVMTGEVASPDVVSQLADHVMVKKQMASILPEGISLESILV